MYHILKEEFVCSKCGAKNNVEHFTNSKGRGIRCLSCKHEKIEISIGQESIGQIYTHKDSIISF